MTNDLRLAVVVATDTFETIEPVVARLRQQTVAPRIELVVVTTQVDAVRGETRGIDELGAVAVVGVDDLVPLGRARATGVRAATAPLVFLGETHTYPQPDWAEKLIGKHDEGTWAAVVPGFGNANPTGALSWAGFLVDYGAWLAGLEARELSAIPTYNTVYRRDELLDHDGDLERLLTTGDELVVRLRGGRKRFAFEPAATIDHVNVSKPVPWLRERYLGGFLTASSRMHGWSFVRRLLYVAASPLIPVVVLKRVAPGVALARGTQSLPALTYPALVASVVVATIGEVAGYLGVPPARGERTMTEYEVHRLRYVDA